MSGKTLQASVSRKNKDGIDFYPTPAWATRALLKRESFTGEIWEPCSGDGAMSRELEAWGYSVHSSDIRTDESIYGVRGVDFLRVTEPQTDNVVTNPPFSYAQQVIEKALLLARHKVAMFLKIAFLESLDRYELFRDSPLSSVYVFSRRVSLQNGLRQKTKGDNGMICFCWFVWDKAYAGEPVIRWIPDAPDGDSRAVQTSLLPEEFTARNLQPDLLREVA